MKILMCVMCGKEAKPGNDLIVCNKHVKKCCDLAIFGLDEIDILEDSDEKHSKK